MFGFNVRCWLCPNSHNVCESRGQNSHSVLFSPIINVNNFKINSNIYILKRRSAPAIRHQGSPQACLLNGSAPRPETVQLPQ